MPFCPTCESILYRKNNYNCLKCDSSITSTKNTTIEPTPSSFPFEIGKYYEQPFIRNKCHAHKQWGISYNQIDNYWVLLKNKKSNTNTYYDRMDENGVFHYTGQGLKGDQIMAGNNDGLKNATSNGQKIHLFWKYNQNSDHKYVGEVKVERIDEEIQNDQDDLPRKVFVFSLRPMD